MKYLGSTLVTMSVVGNDGYSNSIVYGISSSQGESTFTLTVPSADMAVSDVVTVEVKLPDGAIITRTASLVFS